MMDFWQFHHRSVLPRFPAKYPRYTVCLRFRNTRDYSTNMRACGFTKMVVTREARGAISKGMQPNMQMLINKYERNL